jgi:hypothetical protein
VSRSSPLSFPSWCDAPRLKDVMVDLRQRRATRRCVRRDAAVGKLILACLSWGFSTALTKIVLDPATLALAVMFLRERIDLPLLTSLVVGLAGSVLVTWHLDTSPGTPRTISPTRHRTRNSLRCDHRGLRSRRHRCPGRSADASGLCSWALARTPPTLVPYLERGIFERTKSDEHRESSAGGIDNRPARP